MFADLAEETVLDGIPLGGAGGVVADGGFQLEWIHHLPLEGVLPGAYSSPVAAAAVGQDQQLGGLRIILASAVAPPPSNVGGGKIWGVMGSAHKDRALVGQQVKNSVKDGYSLGLGAKIMIVDCG